MAGQDDICTQWLDFVRREVGNNMLQAVLQISALCDRFAETALDRHPDLAGILTLADNQIFGGKILYLFPPSPSSYSSNSNSKLTVLFWQFSPEQEDNGIQESWDLTSTEVHMNADLVYLNETDIGVHPKFEVRFASGWQTVEPDVVCTCLPQVASNIPAQYSLNYGIPLVFTESDAGRRALCHLWTSFKPTRYMMDSEEQDRRTRRKPPPCLKFIFTDGFGQILSIESQIELIKTIGEIQKVATANPCLRGFKFEFGFEVVGHFGFRFSHFGSYFGNIFTPLGWIPGISERLTETMKKSLNNICLCRSDMMFHRNVPQNIYSSWRTAILDGLNEDGISLEYLNLSYDSEFGHQDLVNFLETDTRLRDVFIETVKFTPLTPREMEALVDVLRHQNMSLHSFFLWQDDRPPVLDYYLKLNRMGRALAGTDSCDAHQLILLLRNVESGRELSPKRSDMIGRPFDKKTKLGLIYGLLQVNPFFKSFCDEHAKANPPNKQSSKLRRSTRKRKRG